MHRPKRIPCFWFASFFGLSSFPHSNHPSLELVPVSCSFSYKIRDWGLLSSSSCASWPLLVPTTVPSTPPTSSFRPFFLPTHSHFLSKAKKYLNLNITLTFSINIVLNLIESKGTPPWSLKLYSNCSSWEAIRNLGLPWVVPLLARYSMQAAAVLAGLWGHLMTSYCWQIFKAPYTSRPRRSEKIN